MNKHKRKPITEVHSDKNGCFLNSEIKQCCCACENQYPLHYHCARHPDLRTQIEKITKEPTCICKLIKEYVCTLFINDGRILENTRHSIGCEGYHKREEKKNE